MTIKWSGSPVIANRHNTKTTIASTPRDES
jgi:hypothetical protein